MGRIAGPLRPPITFVSFGRARLHVDRHREERVDQRNRVGAGFFGRPRERRDVGHVRRELGNHRQRVTLRTPLTTSWVPCRLQPNWMPPSLMFGQEMFSSIAATPSWSDRTRATSQVLVQRRSADVDDGRRAEPAQFRQFFGDEPMHADALQADRVQHAGRRFHDARRRVALALFEEQALDRHAAERARGRRRRRIRGRSRSSRTPR